MSDPGKSAKQQLREEESEKLSTDESASTLFDNNPTDGLQIHTYVRTRKTPSQDKKNSLKRKRQSACPQELPLHIIDALQRAGAGVERLPGEGLSYVHDVIFGDAASSLYFDWVNSSDVDPRVMCHFSPSLSIVGTVLCPRPGLVGTILTESNSICEHFALKTASDFLLGMPVIPGPLAAPRAWVSYRHPQLALHALHQCIQSAPRQYPVLRSRPSGSYLVTNKNEYKDESGFGGSIKGMPSCLIQ